MTPHEPEMTAERTEAIRVLLAGRIRDEPQFRRQRSRRLMLIWFSIGVFTIGGLSTAGSILFQDAPVADHTIVHCLSSIVPHADGSFPGSSATIADEIGPGRVEDALGLCRSMWQQGVLSGKVDATAPTQIPHDLKVPILQVCVMRDGTAAVVPSDNRAICQSLGMSSLDR